MTNKLKILLKGATAVAAAALVAGLLIAYTNSAKLGGEGREGEEDREGHVQTTRSGDDLLPDHLRDPAQALLHPGRIVEMEPKNGGRTFGIETVEADGRVLRDERD
jgi:hypothetical protein